ncbi:MAG: hypothetical protein IT454_12045 [Planctomycetes bacterium]|nr:hypothetical protein [Planctomycetota bacterium]
MLTTPTVAAALISPFVPAPEIDLALRVTTHEIVAVNPTDRPEILFVFDAHSTPRGALVVPARGQARWSVLPGGLRGLEFVVATRNDLGTACTFKWTFEAFAALADDFVWIDVDRGRAHAWKRTQQGFAPLAPELLGGSVPPPNFLCAPSNAAHVPVITPHKGSAGEVPPRLERQPLPPI